MNRNVWLVKLIPYNHSCGRFEVRCLIKVLMLSWLLNLNGFYFVNKTGLMALVSRSCASYPWRHGGFRGFE